MIDLFLDWPVRLRQICSCTIKKLKYSTSMTFVLKLIINNSLSLAQKVQISLFCSLKILASSMLSLLKLSVQSLSSRESAEWLKIDLNLSTKLRIDLFIVLRMLSLLELSFVTLLCLCYISIMSQLCLNYVSVMSQLCLCCVSVMLFLTRS